MDFISSLATVGNFINDREKPPNIKSHSGRIKRTNINGDNIYNSWNLKDNRRQVKSAASSKYKQSQNPEVSGVVPNLYNQSKAVKNRKDRAIRSQSVEGFADNDSAFSDSMSQLSFDHKSMDTINADPTSLFKKSNLLSDNRVHEREFNRKIKSTTNGPGFLSQFEELSYNNPSDPVSANNVHHQSGDHSDVAKLETERNLALDGNFSSFVENNDMTYGVVNDNNFSHNNMVPNFKRGAGKGYGPDSVFQKKLDDVNQRKMERFSGSTKNVEYRPKTERKPLFNPHVGLTNIYGMPNFTDYHQSRYIPGRERRNEKIHQEVKVTPGLNLNYNEISTQGFHDTFRALPKTVDELRVASDPKISYGNVVIPGMKSVKRPIIPNVAKRSPATFKENDPRDFVKSMSYYRAPAVYGNFDAPATNRQMTTKEWFSAAGADATFHKPDSMREKVKISHKENFKSAAPRNTTGVESKKATTSTANTYFLEPTNRQTTENRTYQQPAGPGYQKGHAFDMQTNAPDQTLRDLTQDNTYQQPAGPEFQKGHAFDMKTNVPDSTLRDLTQDNTYQQPAGPEYQKGHAFDMQTNVPDQTLRDLTQNRTYQQPSTLHEGMKGGYQSEHFGTIAPTTLRQTTQNNTYQQPSGFNEGQKGGYHAQQSGTIAPTTMRQITQNNTYQQPSGFNEGQKGGYHAQQSGTIAPTTTRQTTQNNTYQQPSGFNDGQKGGYHAEQSGTIAPTTMRQTTQNNTYQQPSGFNDGQKGGYHAEQSGTIAHTTMRQTTQNNTYQQPSGFNDGQKGGYHAEQSGTIAPTTMRQMTQNNTYQQPSGFNDGQKGGYHAEQSGTIAPTTLRQMTQNNTYQQPSGFNDGQKGGYHAEQSGTIAPTTLRQLTQNNTYQQPSGFNDGQKGGYHAEQSGTIAPTTLRQLTQDKTYQGPVIQHEGQKGGYHAAQSGTVAPTTLRQLTQDKTYQGPVIHHGGQKGGYHAAQAGTVAPTTLRQLTQDKTYQGPLVHHGKTKGGYHVEHQNTIAPTTLRQLTQNNTYQGPLTHHEGQKTRGRSDAANSLVNIQKEATNIVRDGGQPVTSNYPKGPNYEGTMTQMCEPIQLNRELYGDMSGQRPLQCLPTMHTRVANVFPHITADRIDTCITQNLATNPFINNTQHKSIDY
jgi:hypothetical protein